MFWRSKKRSPMEAELESLDLNDSETMGMDEISQGDTGG